MRPSPLDGASCELLFQLLESSSPTIPKFELEEIATDEGQALIEHGLLQPSGTARSVPDRSDYDDVPIAVDYDAERGSFGYMGRSGWIDVPDRLLQLYKVDLVRIALLMTTRLRADELRPTPLIDDVLLEIGIFKLGGSRSVWFARRLGEQAICDAVLRKSRDRPSPHTRLILTSTPASELEIVQAHDCVFVDCRDVVDDPASIKIDPDRLQKRAEGRPSPGVATPIWLSPDGAELVLLGRTTISFTSARQIEVIRRLVDAHADGRRLPAKDLLSASPSVRTLAQLFGAKKWAVLSQNLKPSKTGWGFEL